MSASGYYHKLASDTRVLAEDPALQDKRRQLIEHILWSFNFFTKQKPIRDMSADQTSILVDNTKNCQVVIKENLWRSELHSHTQEAVEGQLKTLGKWGQIHKSLSVLIYHSLASNIDFAAIFHHKGFLDLLRDNPVGYQLISSVHEKGIVQPLELESLLKRTLNLEAEMLRGMYMNQPILLKYTSNNILLLHLVFQMIAEIVKETGVSCLLNRARTEYGEHIHSQLRRLRMARRQQMLPSMIVDVQSSPQNHTSIQLQIGLMLASQETTPSNKTEAWKESMCKSLFELIKSLTESTKEVTSKLAKAERSESLVFVFRELVFLPLVNLLDAIQIKYHLDSAQRLQKDLIRVYVKFAPIRPDDWALLLFMEKFKMCSDRVTLSTFIPHCTSISNTNLIVSAFDSMDKRCVENLSPRDIFSIALFLDSKYLNTKSMHSFAVRLNEVRSELKNGEEISLDSYPAIVDLALSFKLKESVLASLTSTPAAMLEPVYCFMLASFTNPAINKYYLESVAKLAEFAHRVCCTYLSTALNNMTDSHLQLRVQVGGPAVPVRETFGCDDCIR